MKRRALWVVAASLLASALSAGNLVAQQPPADAQGALETAQRLLRLERPEEAMQLLDAALERWPSDQGLATLRAFARSRLVDERERLIEVGLASFFDDPARSCRAWSRLLEIDPDDEAAARYISILSQEVEHQAQALERQFHSQLERAAWPEAAALIDRVEDLECVYRRSADLRAQLVEVRTETLRATILMRSSEAFLGQCQPAEALLRTAVGEPNLAAGETATAYLALGSCESLTSLETARQSFRRALAFDGDARLPSHARPELHALLSELRGRER